MRSCAFTSFLTFSDILKVRHSCGQTIDDESVTSLRYSLAIFIYLIWLNRMVPLDTRCFLWFSQDFNDDIYILRSPPLSLPRPSQTKLLPSTFNPCAIGRGRGYTLTGEQHGDVSHRREASVGKQTSVLFRSVRSSIWKRREKSMKACLSFLQTFLPLHL